MSANVLHVFGLEFVGGAQLQLAEFASCAAASAAGRQDILAFPAVTHPSVARRIDYRKVSVFYENRLGELRIPPRPHILKSLNRRRVLRRVAPDFVLFWNGARDYRLVEQAGLDRAVHWERGGAWYSANADAQSLYFSSIRRGLFNSYASKRVAELKWGFSGAGVVVPNALRPSVAKFSSTRSLPASGTLRLVVVSRLAPMKAVNLAIHSVRCLHEMGIDASLDIMGEGSEREPLEELIKTMGLQNRVRLLGLVGDVGAVLARCDILLHTSIREPFGQVVLEANMAGIPAIAANVDGLPEVIEDNETGFCIAPELPLKDFDQLGGTSTRLPAFVYDPQADTLTEPQLLDPQHVADAVKRLVDDPALYRRMSNAAIDRTRTHFNFNNHVESVLSALDSWQATK